MNNRRAEIANIYNQSFSNIDGVCLPKITLNAKTGNLIWKFDLDEKAPRRGMVYLKKDIKNPPRLFFSSYKKLISLNADSGKLTKTFGKNGVVKLKRPSITAPSIFKNNLIITTSEPSMEVYDINTGNLLWKFILMEKKSKSRNGGKRYDYSGGNPWGGFSLDKVRGIAWSGDGRGILRVEISFNKGISWTECELKEGSEQKIGKSWAWTFWEYNKDKKNY